uniref:Uncharacterized protein n=1 Tax=Panagrolaimus davidi TaxID=227884 RepID=A0A914Q0P4_9BILA
MIRQYFEIMPVKLIELGNPYALLKLLEQLNSHNISVKILRSGQILRLDDFYDIHHKMFLNLKSVNTFMKALTILRSLNKKLAFYKAGDLSIIESESFIEPVDFCRSIVLDVPNENGIELQSYYPNEVHYFPKCQYCKWDLSESHMAIINYMPFAMMWDSFRECWNNDELRKEIHLVVKYMKQCVFSWHHLFAYFRKPLIITNLNRYRYDSTNLEYILLNETMHFRTLELFANAEKYNEFFYQNTGHLPEETAYLEFILIFKKLLYDEGLLLWFNDDTVTFFSSYAYDKYDGYKRSLICKEVMPQAILGSLDYKNAMQWRKDNGITAPSILILGSDSAITFYIAADGMVFQVRGRFAEALQSYMEMVFVSNVKYDSKTTGITYFFEYLMNIKDHQNASRMAVKKELDAIADKLSNESASERASSFDASNDV